MKYAIRNSIILFIILLLVFTGFKVYSIPNSTKVKKLKKTYQENLKLLEDLRTQNPNIEDQYKIEYLLSDLQEKKRQTGKFILKKEDPIFSYKYFLDICDKFSSKMEFDFNISKQTDANNQTFNSYTLTGIAYIDEVYNFLYQLEKQYLLYIITAVDITEESTKDATVKFEISIQGYQADSGTVEEEAPWRTLPPRHITYDPLLSRIHGPIERSYEEKFINVEKVRVIGLSAEKVFLAEENGTITVLAPGDKVGYGYIDYINLEEQYVQFKLNKIGIITTHKLYLEKEKL